MEQAAFIYNVTAKVTPAIHQQWLQWMREEYIPSMLATGCFFNAVILRLKEVDDSDGPTYAIQYHAASKADYNRFILSFHATLQQQIVHKWGQQYLAFSTIMEVVN